MWGWGFSQLTPLLNGVSSKMRHCCRFFGSHGNKPLRVLGTWLTTEDLWEATLHSATL